MKLGIKICLYWILFPIFTSIILINLQSLPIYSGHITVERNFTKINITRDSFGRPTIQADNLQDAMYGLGCAHAQDRIWTMDLRRRLSQGRLSEIVGKVTFPIDKFMRNLGIKRYSEINFEYLDNKTRGHYEAYSDGVNDCIKSSNFLPFEYWIAWLRFENWTVIDSMSIFKAMSLFMAHDFSFEFSLEVVAERVGLDFASQIYPGHQDQLLWPNSTILSDEDLNISEISEGQPKRQLESIYTYQKLDELMAAKQSERGQDTELEEGVHELASDAISMLKKDSNYGSNCYVIHGNHTASGKPILGLDSHLDNNIPSYWMQARIILPDGKYISGSTLAGVPGVHSGKTNDFVWGYTSSGIDTTDIYKLQIGENYTYLYEGQNATIYGWEDVIEMRGEKPSKIQFLMTHQGILLEHFYPLMNFRKLIAIPDTHKYALAWTGYISNDTSYAVWFDLMEAKTTEEIIEAHRGAIVPSQNLLFATHSGDIGYLATGQIPLLKSLKKNPGIKEGWLESNNWYAPVPFESHPRVINPRKGYIINANNRIASDKIHYSSSANMVTTPRAVRIEELITSFIKSGKKITTEDALSIQLDTVDILFRDIFIHLVDAVKKYLENENEPRHQLAREILSEVKAWDFRIAANSWEALVFNVWETKFKHKLFLNLNFTDDEREKISDNFKTIHFIFKNLRDIATHNTINQSWCSDFQRNKTCLDHLSESYIETIRFLQNSYGQDFKSWKWSDLHHFEYKNLPFSFSPLKLFFHRSIPQGGNGRTVFLSSYNTTNYNGIISANLRMVATPDIGGSTLIIDTGVSGHFLSRNYDDQLFRYHQFEDLKLEEKEIGEIVSEYIISGTHFQ